MPDKNQVNKTGYSICLIVREPGGPFSTNNQLVSHMSLSKSIPSSVQTSLAPLWNGKVFKLHSCNPELAGKEEEEQGIASGPPLTLDITPEVLGKLLLQDMESKLVLKITEEMVSEILWSPDIIWLSRLLSKSCKWKSWLLELFVIGISIYFLNQELIYLVK